MKDFLHYTTILACLALLFCVSVSTVSSEEEADPPKKAASANASGIVSAVNAGAKSITITLQEKKKKAADGEDENAEDGMEVEAVAKTLTVTCNDDTVIKTGKDVSELSAIAKDDGISVKYDPETKVASSIRIKKMKEVKEGEKDKKEDHKKKEKPENGLPQGE